MVLLQTRPVQWRGIGYVRGGQFNGGRMVMLQRWTVYRRENHRYGGGRFNGQVTEVVTLMEGKWSYYRSGH